MHIIAASSRPNLGALRALRDVFPDMIRTKTQPELQLPIHIAALKSSSVELMKEFIEMYPKGVSTLDNEGKIVIHYICENASDAALPMLEMVLKVNPVLAKISTANGLLPNLAICNESVTESIRLEMIVQLSELYLRSIEQLHTVKYKHGSIKETIIHTICRMELPSTESLLARLLKAFPDCTYIRNPAKESPLHIIIGNSSITKEGMDHIVTMLLEANPAWAKVQYFPGPLQPEVQGGYPLHRIASRRNVNINTIGKLARAYALPLRANHPQYGTPLSQSVSSGDVERMKFIYDLYPDAIISRNRPACIPLHAAVRYDNLDMVKAVYELHPDAITYKTILVRLRYICWPLASAVRTNGEICLLLRAFYGFSLPNAQILIMNWTHMVNLLARTSRTILNFIAAYFMLLLI